MDISQDNSLVEFAVYFLYNTLFMSEMMSVVTVAITGASGSIYGWDILQKLELTENIAKIFLVISSTGRDVLAEELGVSVENQQSLEQLGFLKTILLDNNNFHAPIASGSHPVDAMVIAPCSMGTLGSMAAGVSRNLIHRAADVTLKERRPLIIVPRETPLNHIHLENMLTLSRAGAVIFPAMPSFYGKPESVSDLVASVTHRILSHLGIPLPSSFVWQGRV